MAPGALVSQMYADARDAPELVAANTQASRIGRPSDMAGTAVYLAWSSGDYVVGATLVVDGGLTYAR